jgi:hypothetical protein
MNGWVQKRRGAVEHLRDGRLTLLEYGALDLLLALADKESGICWVSAKALAAICGAGDFSERQARHVLESLEKKGYIRRFATKRGRGNYPILVNKFEVTWGAYKGTRLNTEKTMDWRRPVYEDCLADGLEQGVDRGPAQGEAEGVVHAPFREEELTKEKEIEQEQKPKNATSASVSIRFSPEVIEAFRALGHDQPFGPPDFQSIWTDEYTHTQNPNGKWTDVMERTIVRCQSSRVKVPPLFINHKRQIERVEVEKSYHRTPL